MRFFFCKKGLPLCCLCQFLCHTRGEICCTQMRFTCIWSPVKTILVFGPARARGVTASGSNACAASSTRIWVKNPWCSCKSSSTREVASVVITTWCLITSSRDGSTNAWFLRRQYFLAVSEVAWNLRMGWYTRSGLAARIPFLFSR